mgnify:CR=1 FL=1
MDAIHATLAGELGVDLADPVHAVVQPEFLEIVRVHHAALEGFDVLLEAGDFLPHLADLRLHGRDAEPSESADRGS